MTWTDNPQNERSKCPQIYDISWTLSMIKEVQVTTMRGHFLPVRIRKGSNSDYSQFVKSLSRVQHFATPWTAEWQASLSFTISQSLLQVMSIESVMPSNHLILCHPLLFLPSSFLATGSFPTNWLFKSGGQSIGASASVLLVSI